MGEEVWLLIIGLVLLISVIYCVFDNLTENKNPLKTLITIREIMMEDIINPIQREKIPLKVMTIKEIMTGDTIKIFQYQKLQIQLLCTIYETLR